MIFVCGSVKYFICTLRETFTKSNLDTFFIYGISDLSCAADIFSSMWISNSYLKSLCQIQNFVAKSISQNMKVC